MKRLSICLLAAVAVACSSIDCPVQNTVSVQYNVCHADGTALSLEDALTVTSVRSDGSDTTLLNLFTGESFSLPVSYSHPEDVLVFSFFSSLDSVATTVEDTVWIKKDDIPHFESVDCSAAFFHRLTDVRYTKNYIDSLVIKNPSVTYDQTTVHLHLYPKVSD